MLNLSIPSVEIRVLLAIVLRLSIVFVMLPFFGGVQVPRTIKIFAILALSAMIYFLPGTALKPLSLDPIELVRVVMGEFVFGVVLGLSLLIVFGAFQLAAEMISFQMGFGFAQAVDPQSGTQVPLVSGWFQVVAMLILLSSNGHHVILKALVESFTRVPVGGFVLGADTVQQVLGFSVQLFVLGMKIAAPVTISILLAHMGLGLINKFAPQINILVASFPVTILVGFLLLGASVSVWGIAMRDSLLRFSQVLRVFFQ
ncbi:MAG TPA: flagellar biosynthetic protein FliR [Syntrophobacteraceae bacterium]|nr:flagellar biosynthetic protein FliR [Syntrophobacteraceae bacterium]